MSHLNFMWCLMMNFPQFHSWRKAQYPQIEHIYCNASHKVVHKRIFTTSMLGSIQILRNIPYKLQLMYQDSHQKVIKHPVSEGVQNTSNLPKFGFYQQSSNVISGVTSSEGKKGLKCLRWPICNQLVLGYMQGWIINPDKNMVYLINYH